MPDAARRRRGATALLDRVDGLLLLGGGDVDPRSTARTPHPTIYGVDRRATTFELALDARRDRRATMPMLAICRGHQVLNVALGGTLDQHIPERAGVARARPSRAPRTARALHDGRRSTPGSLLAKAMGTTASTCSCTTTRPSTGSATGCASTARADDGIVEGVELDGDAWVVGVQWHPEDTAATDPAQQRLFDTFVDGRRQDA